MYVIEFSNSSRQFLREKHNNIEKNKINLGERERERKNGYHNVIRINQKPNSA